MKKLLLLLHAATVSLAAPQISPAAIPYGAEEYLQGFCNLTGEEFAERAAGLLANALSKSPTGVPPPRYVWEDLQDQDNFLLDTNDLFLSLDSLPSETKNWVAVGGFCCCQDSEECPTADYDTRDPIQYNSFCLEF